MLCIFSIEIILQKSRKVKKLIENFIDIWENFSTEKNIVKLSIYDIIVKKKITEINI